MLTEDGEHAAMVEATVRQHLQAAWLVHHHLSSRRVSVSYYDAVSSRSKRRRGSMLSDMSGRIQSTLARTKSSSI